MQILTCCRGTRGKVDEVADSRIVSLRQDWDSAVADWEKLFRSQKFLREQRVDAEREAARQKSQQQKRKVEEKTREFAEDVDRWHRSMVMESQQQQAPQQQQCSASGSCPTSREATAAPRRTLVLSDEDDEEEEEEFDHEAVYDLVHCEVSQQASKAHASACMNHRQHKYRDSIMLFTIAIDQCSRHDRSLARMYSNRAASYYCLREFHSCLQDALRSAELDASYIPGHARAARCYLLLLNLRHARVLQQFLLQQKSCYDPTVDVRATACIEQYRRALNDHQYDVALRHVAQACITLPNVAFEILRIECLAQLRPEEALEEVVSLLGEYGDVPDLLYWRGLLLYQLNADALSLGACEQQLLRAMSASSHGGHEKAKRLLALVKKVEMHRATALLHVSNRRWRLAVDEYTALLSTNLENDRLMCLVLLQRATAQLNLSQHAEAIKDCTRALELHHGAPYTAQLLAVRAEAFAATRFFDKAVDDAEEAYKQNPSSETFEKLSEYKRRKAEAYAKYASASSAAPNPNGTRRASAAESGPNCSEERSSSRKGCAPPPRSRSAADPQLRKPQPTLYDALGVDRNAETSRIVRAFRESALRWHPDKWVSYGAKDRANAEDMFKKINHAYGVLLNESSRRSYDLTLSNA